MQSQEQFHVRCALLAAERTVSGGSAQGKGATGPRDRQEGHRDATGQQVTGSDPPLALRTRR